MVFPRNQVRTDYLACLSEHGFTSYRGNQRGWMYRPELSRGVVSKVERGARLADAYVPAGPTARVHWDSLRVANGLVNIPASRLLRPYSPRFERLDGLRLGRITGSLRDAAQSNAIYHLWWHPHNFGAHLDENLRFLEAILQAFVDCAARYGMRSMTMSDVALAVLQDDALDVGRARSNVGLHA
jgi:hypothetical protein